MEERKIVTVDLGTNKIQLCVAHKTLNGKIEVDYCKDTPSEGIARGKVQNPTRLSEALNLAVSDAEAALGINITELMVGCQKYDIRQMDKESRLDLSGEDCISKENIDRLEASAECEMEEQISGDEEILAMVAQSFGTQDELGLNAEEINGMMGEYISGNYKVFTGKTVISKSIDKAFELQGSQIIHKSFTQAETGMAVLTKTECESGVALVDFGAGATSVSVYCGGTLRYYTAFPFGGNTITADIHNLCGITDKLAENIKKAYGGCMPDKLESLGEKTIRIKDSTTDTRTEITAKYLSEIITARVKEIIDAILYGIQESGYADKLKNGIVLVGGCAMMLNLNNLIKQMSGYNTRIGAPSHSIFESEEKLFFTCSSATSAGLLIRLMGKEGVKCTGEKTSRRVDLQPGITIEIKKNGTDLAPDAEKGNELFGEEEKSADKHFLEGIFGGGKQPGQKEKKKKEAKPKKEKEETGSLFGSFLDIFEDDTDDSLNKL